MRPTAHDWVARVAVARPVADRWPDYRVHLVACDDVDADGLHRVADALIEHAVGAVRSGGGDDAHVLRWQDAYRDFGTKPRIARSSVDALLRRAASESGLPRINVLVDVYNAISVLHRVPIGGEDLDRYDGPARLVLATGDEPFHTTAHGEAVVDHPDQGEPVWIDDTGVTCRRWNWRQTTRTAITTSTRRVGFIVESLDAPRHDGARLAAEQLAEILPDACVRTIDATTVGGAPG
jgi:DNA/RNA-binding domain of Phe-tRNA-synthetase-like protein